jgi:oligopeptide transport system substrate-binding protein
MVRLLALGSFTIIALLALYTLQSDVDRADLTYVNPSGIHTLDPARMSWTQDFRIALNIWEGLTTWDPKTTEPTGGAAHFPPEISKDGSIYKFTLREDARWSNGDLVTSHDFVRGWRRGMEPGTATDYTFLFTKHIIGARDYVAWRRRGVAELTALSRLRDGWAITEDQARAILDGASFPIIRTANPEVAQRLEDQAESVALLAAQLARADVSWDKVFDEVFEMHVAEMDARFMGVGIEAPDKRTIVVYLKHPCAYFLDLTAAPIFLPCHQSIEQLRTRFRGSPITEQGLVVYNPQWTKPDFHHYGYAGLITNGPYRLEDWILKRRIRLGVNPYHREAAAIQCRTVDMLVYDNINAAIMAYESGHVDFLPAMNVTYDHEIARLAGTGQRPDFHFCHVLATYFLSFNCDSSSVGGFGNPFQERRVREAFALAVDRDRIVKDVLGRGDRAAFSFVPPARMAGYTPPRMSMIDPQRAREVLREAGFPDGVGLPPIEFLYTQRDERIAQAIGRMWERELGAHVILRSQESKTFAEDKAKRRFLVARGNWYADYNDPTTFLDCLTSDSGNNDGGYSNKEYDDLLAAARSETNAERRLALLYEAESIIVQRDFPILPILHYADPIAISPRVQGLYPNPRMWFSFKHVYKDE